MSSSTSRAGSGELQRACRSPGRCPPAAHLPALAANMHQVIWMVWRGEVSRGRFILPVHSVSWTPKYIFCSGGAVHPELDRVRKLIMRFTFSPKCLIQQMHLSTWGLYKQNRTWCYLPHYPNCLYRTHAACYLGNSSVGGAALRECTWILLPWKPMPLPLYMSKAVSLLGTGLTVASKAKLTEDVVGSCRFHKLSGQLREPDGLLAAPGFQT